MDVGFVMTYAGALASFLAIGAMVTHLLLSKEILRAGSMLEAAQWTLAVLSLVAAIVSIVDYMATVVGPSGDAVGPSVGGILLFILVTVGVMVGIVVGAVALDSRENRKTQKADAVSTSTPNQDQVQGTAPTPPSASEHRG